MAADIGTLTPEQMLQQQQILRQQKMAEMLMQQGSQQPQGQMISGRYVAPSFTQNLASLANMYVGQRNLEKADQAQIDLAKQLRADETSAMADFIQQKQGKAGVEGGIYGPNNQITTQTTADMYGPNMELNPQYKQVAPVAAIPANPQAAYANLYANPKASAAQRNFAFTKMNADPEAFTLSENAVRFEKQPDGTVKQVAAGAKKPIQIDTGTAIEFRDPDNISIVLQRIPKSQMPTGGQVIDREDGIYIVNPRTAQATQVLGSDGQPLKGSPSASLGKEFTELNQQKSIINGVLKGVENNRDAFGPAIGAKGSIPFGDVAQNRKFTPAQLEARSEVFNTASAVIKERAGTAQSASEKETIMRFLPSPFDGADVIIGKMNGYNRYIQNKEAGTSSVRGAVPAYYGKTSKELENSNVAPKPATNNAPMRFASEADAANAKLQDGTPIIINGVEGIWKN